MIRIVPAGDAQQKAEAFSIRTRVFVCEQGFPLHAEFDLDDLAAFHALAFLQGKPVGTARLVIRGGEGRIGRLAVLPPFRRMGIGLALLEFLTEEARRRGATRLVLHAQLPALSLYLRAGFFVTSSLFLEDGVLHCRLERWVDGTSQFR